MINRAKLRGKPLDADCKRAHTSRYEYGLEDDRVFCFGIIDCKESIFLPKCMRCRAFVNNAEPPREVTQ